MCPVKWYYKNRIEFYFILYSCRMSSVSSDARTTKKTPRQARLGTPKTQSILSFKSSSQRVTAGFKRQRIRLGVPTPDAILNRLALCNRRRFYRHSCIKTEIVRWKSCMFVAMNARLGANDMFTHIHLFAGKDQTLLLRRNSLLFFNTLLDAINLVSGLDVDFNLLARKCLPICLRMTLIWLTMNVQKKTRVYTIKLTFTLISMMTNVS